MDLSFVAQCLGVDIDWALIMSRSPKIVALNSYRDLPSINFLSNAALLDSTSAQFKYFSPS
jgi:hypothetical protein